MVRARSFPSAAAWALGLGLAGASACAPRPRASMPSPATAGASPLGRTPLSQVHPEDLARPPKDPVEAAWQLDVALDAFDAARFARDEHARRLLAAYIGPLHPPTGPVATATAVERLLGRAWTWAEHTQEAGATPPRVADFFADAAGLLAADLYQPDRAEDLLARVDAYRTAVELGSSAVADNAHLRLYDHARGCIADAASLPAPRRYEVALFALLAAGRDAEAFLATPPRAPYPAPEDFEKILLDHLEPLKNTPSFDRWIPKLEARARDLVKVAAVRLPTPRLLVTETAARIAPVVFGPPPVRDDLSPVLFVGPEGATFDPGLPTERRVPLADPGDSEELAGAVSGGLARDGRGSLLLVPSARTPAPVFARLLDALLAADVERIDLAVRTPAEAVPPGGPRVLPLHVAAPDDVVAVRLARAARVQLEITEEGPRIHLGGLQASPVGGPLPPSELRRWAARVRRAYPRETALRVVLAPAVPPALLVEGLAAFLVPTDDRGDSFTRAVWLPGAAPEADRSQPRRGRRPASIERRLAWVGSAVEVTAPYSLRQAEQNAVLRAADEAASCAPDLAPLRPGAHPVRVRLRFDGGVLQDLNPVRPRRLPDPFLRCLWEVFGSVRLPHHRETLPFDLQVAAPRSRGGGRPAKIL